ncbi:hypothetical protein AWJ20_4288 [Sugiyamaella lignohabitans]|uniref:Ribosome biogenesis protein ALB1 n=1 Tax=Sugiyamaella lignohabitans TaxID=796027 RepID=A0A167CBS0_9ASCO|nr:uncharacterized protein AWJ20_4288 [Sugiyamaella lignohabitans]ANB11476.1 hypothetical protein AWJ20_4288 [Sugiyamaella lignohabitans]
MPSRNSINKPKLTARKPQRPTGKKPMLLTASSSSGAALSTKVAGGVTTKVISKKRSKKDQRNAKYRAEYLKALETDVAMNDGEEGLSNRQKKKQARLQTLALILESDLPAEDMEFESTSGGTTLGGPVL